MRVCNVLEAEPQCSYQSLFFMPGWWILKCWARWLLREKPLPHLWHLCFLPREWFFMWRLRLLLHLNWKPHKIHSNSFTSECTLECCSMLFLLINLFPHSSHLRFEGTLRLVLLTTFLGVVIGLVCFGAVWMTSFDEELSWQVLIWWMRRGLILKFFPHTLQICLDIFFFWLWSFKCRLRLFLHLNWKPHNSHLYSLTSECTLACCRKHALDENPFPHISHLNAFTPKCNNSCPLRSIFL